jgi:hypothetical protein
MSFSHSKKAGTIMEGDAVKLTCRTKEWHQDKENLPNITWHWSGYHDEENVSVALESGSSLVPAGVKIAEQTKQNINGYSLSNLSWLNISSQAAGTYKCTHEQSGVSASYILAVSCT